MSRWCTCPHPAARIVSIDKTRRAAPCRACTMCWTGVSSPPPPMPLMTGLDTPNVPRYPLAVDVARYAGEWVAAVVADTRALAEDAAEGSTSTTSRCRSCSTPRRPTGRAARRCMRRTAPTCCSTAPSSGARSRRISPRARTRCRSRVKWGRSSTVPIETFGVLAQLGPLARDARRLGLDPDAEISRPDRARRCSCRAHAVRVHYDVDVGGSYGVKRGIKHTVLVGYLVAPARLPGAADRGPAGEHARRRRARAGAHLRCRGRLRRRRHHPLDEDARARQCRRLCRAARRSSSASRSAPSSVRTRSRACSTAPSR